MGEIGLDRLILQIEAQMKGAEAVINKINLIGSAMKRINNRTFRITDAIESSFGRSSQAVDGINGMLKRTVDNFDNLGSVKALKKIEKGADKGKKSINGMNGALISFSLSMLFFGMALKNFSQNLIKDLGNVFMLLADEMNVGVKRVMELQASLQFLKFVLFDTFANSALFGTFVEFIVNAVNALSEFVQKHPELTTMFFIFLAIGVVLGGMLLLLGIMGSSLSGLIAGFTILEGLTLAKVIFSLWGVFGAFAIIFAAILLVIGLFKIWSNDTMSEVDKIAARILLLSLFMAVVGLAFRLWPVAAVAAVVAIIALMFLLRDQIGNAFKQVGLLIEIQFLKLELEFHSVMRSMFGAVLDFVEPAIGLINKLIEAWNRIPFFGDVATIDVSGLRTDLFKPMIDTAEKLKESIGEYNNLVVDRALMPSVGSTIASGFGFQQDPLMTSAAGSTDPFTQAASMESLMSLANVSQETLPSLLTASGLNNELLDTLLQEGTEQFAESKELDELRNELGEKKFEEDLKKFNELIGVAQTSDDTLKSFQSGGMKLDSGTISALASAFSSAVSSLAASRPLNNSTKE